MDYNVLEGDDMEDSRFLQEEILLLALRDGEETTGRGTSYLNALAGARLAELSLRDRIIVDRYSKDKLVEVVSAQPVGDPLLDDCLAAIATAKQPATTEAWVLKFVHITQMKDRIAERLCRQGMLWEGKGKTVGSFTRREYFELNPETKKRLIRRLGHAMFGTGGSLDKRTRALLSLAYHSGLLGQIFGRKETRSCKTRVDRITRSEAVVQTVSEAIEATRSATFEATAIPANIST
jgi:hypothetical protein